MPIVEGKKWACGRCIQGHRVRSCNHSDRPLQHVRDKGRPVTQCKTCRKNRQSSGAHTKCDCGRWTAKCEHLSTASHRHTCCCNHDGVCTCCSSKTKLQAESDQEGGTSPTEAPVTVTPRRSSASPKPRVPTTVRNHRSRVRPHQTAVPYTLSRGNSNHSISSQDDLDDEAWGMPHAEGQLSASSDTTSPLMTGLPYFQQQQEVTPLHLDILENFPLFMGTDDGLFSEVEQPIMSASLETDPKSWPCTWPGPSLSGESNTPLDLPWPEAWAYEDQVVGSAIEQCYPSLQQNVTDQAFMPAASEPEYFADAWIQTRDTQEWAVLNGNTDLNDPNDLNCDLFYPDQ